MKRGIMLVVTILWYLAAIAFIIGFFKQLFSGAFFSGDGEGIWLIVVNFFITMVLCGAQMVITIIVGRMYDLEAYIQPGRINLLGLIISPLLLCWNLFYTLRILWTLIRYSPEE